jgi:hypothetical protein
MTELKKLINELKGYGLLKEAIRYCLIAFISLTIGSYMSYHFWGWLGASIFNAVVFSISVIYIYFSNYGNE